MIYKTRLLHDYVKNVYKINRHTDRKYFNLKVKELRETINDICDIHGFSKINNIDIILAFNIFDNEYINSDRVIKTVLTKVEKPKPKPKPKPKLKTVNHIPKVMIQRSTVICMFNV